MEANFTQLVSGIALLEGVGRQLDPDLDLFKALRNLHTVHALLVVLRPLPPLLGGPADSPLGTPRVQAAGRGGREARGAATRLRLTRPVRHKRTDNVEQHMSTRLAPTMASTRERASALTMAMAMQYS